MRDIVSPLDGFLSPFGVVRGAWSPSTLFAAGETGAWYEPGVGSLQTASGEITEAGPGDPVGFQLDKSQGVGFSGGSFTGLGSELVTNGGFDTDSDWTKDAGWTISGGVATKAVSGANSSLSQVISISEESVYLITLDATVNASGFIVQFDGGGLSSAGPFINATGTYEIVLSPNASNTQITMRGFSAFVGSVDNISVREIPGNHATQSTAAARPTLRQTGGGLYYLEDDLVDDAINWTAPADTDYTITRINRAGTVTAQTGQSLSGSTDALVEQYVAAYVAVDRALTAGETADLAAYLEGL